MRQQDVISVIEKYLGANQGCINSVFQDFLDARPRWGGMIHCQAALASLILYATLKLEGHDNIKHLMQVSPFTLLLIMIA